MGAHSLVAPAQQDRSGESIEVPIEPLSAILEPGTPFVLFVDVEGFEPQVMRGGAAAIERDCRAIVLEVTPARYSADDTLDLHRRISAFSSEFFLLASGERCLSRDLGILMAKRQHGQFNIALLRGNP